MKKVTRNEVGFSELFHYAKDKFNVSWNDCCDIFHRTELLNYRENTEFYLEELEGDVDPENKWGFKSEQKKRAAKILIEYMKENDVHEITVTGSGPS